MKRGYKVTDVKREKKIGVAAGSLEELIQKSCNKLGFNVGCAECWLYVAEDGTHVDDEEYLATLPPQTLFILLKKKEKMVTDFDHFYNLIRSHKKDYIDAGEAVEKFLTTNIKEKFKVFQKYIAAADDAKTMLSERTQDPEWFEGLEPSEKNKEQSMSKRVKDRMRGYYYKTKSALQSSELYVHSRNGRDFGHLYNLLRLHKNDTLIDIGEDAEKFVIANIKEIVKIFNRFHAFANESKTMLSERSQDPDWFEGLHSSNENKEEVMSRRAKDRMENYLNVTKNKLQKSDLYKDSRNKLGKILIDRFVEDLKRLLVSKNYNMSYFNRKAREDARLCHENGVFECGGLWNNEKCSYEGEHITNPYRSYRERVGFKCWQLDHKIELSRSIIPKIMEAVKALYMGDFRCIICNKGTNPGAVEPDRYYKQIFTRENLKLVHVECHNTQKRPNNHSGVFTVCKNCFGGQNIQ